MPEIRNPFIVYDPIGTLDELKANSLSPATFASCSEPDGVKNVGCRRWPVCEMSYKKNGPANHAVRLVKSPENGMGVREVVKACYRIIDEDEQLRDNKTVQRIVASEARIAPKGGKTNYQFTGTRPESAPTTTNPNPRFVPFIEEREITPFPRPQNNPEYIRLQYAHKMFKSSEREREDVQYEMAVGNPVTEHMDVRHLYGIKASGEGKSSKPDEGRPKEGDTQHPSPGKP